jgi:hypothetical protein
MIPNVVVHISLTISPNPFKIHHAARLRFTRHDRTGII